MYYVTLEALSGREKCGTLNYHTRSGNISSDARTVDISTEIPSYHIFQHCQKWDNSGNWLINTLSVLIVHFIIALSEHELLIPVQLKLTVMMLQTITGN